MYYICYYDIVQLIQNYLICSTSIDNCPPVNLNSLLVQLRPQVGPKWFEFGKVARIGRDVLDKIAEQCSPEECIVELFDHWLFNEKPTWRDVADILKQIGLTELGLNIESVYTTGMTLIVVNISLASQPLLLRKR